VSLRRSRRRRVAGKLTPRSVEARASALDPGGEAAREALADAA
jgi:hypothetical protein